MAWNEEEDPKSPFNWWLKAYKFIHWLWRAVSSKPGAQNQKPKLAADRRTSRDRVAGGALRATHFRSLGRISAAMVWSRVPGFDARLHTRTLVPNFAYKYPGVFQSTGRGSFW